MSWMSSDYLGLHPAIRKWLPDQPRKLWGLGYRCVACFAHAFRTRLSLFGTFVQVQLQVLVSQLTVQL